MNTEGGSHELQQVQGNQAAQQHYETMGPIIYQNVMVHCNVSVVQCGFPPRVAR